MFLLCFKVVKMCFVELFVDRDTLKILIKIIALRRRRFFILAIFLLINGHVLLTIEPVAVLDIVRIEFSL